MSRSCRVYLVPASHLDQANLRDRCRGSSTILQAHSKDLVVFPASSCAERSHLACKEHRPLHYQKQSLSGKEGMLEATGFASNAAAASTTAGSVQAGTDAELQKRPHTHSAHAAFAVAETAETSADASQHNPLNPSLSRNLVNKDLGLSHVFEINPSESAGGWFPYCDGLQMLRFSSSVLGTMACGSLVRIFKC